MPVWFEINVSKKFTDGFIHANRDIEIFSYLLDNLKQVVDPVTE